MLKKHVYKTELEQGEKNSSYFLHLRYTIFTSRQEANACKKNVYSIKINYF